MLAALVLALWLWDRVVSDCHGQPETASYYYLQATVRVSTTATCFNDDGQPYECSVTVPGAPTRFTADIQDPGSGTTVTTTYDPVGNPSILPVPPIGVLMAWPWASADNPTPVVAIDEAGNKSDAPCP